jgi:hypothetical protein
MPQTQVDAARRRGTRAAAPLAAAIAGALAGACCVSACGGGATVGTASGTPASSASSTPASSTPASGTPASGTPAGSAAPSGQGAAAASHSTPGAALADWIHQVAVGNRSASCQDMREPGLSAQGSAGVCMSAKAAGTFTALHHNFVIDGIRAGTPISVAAPHAAGSSVTVSGSDVRVSGTTLESLMAAHSTGVKPGQLTIAFGLSRVDGGWYVTGMNMNL